MTYNGKVHCGEIAFDVEGVGANLPRSCSIGPSIILRVAGRLTGSTTFRARRDRSFLEQSGSLASLTEGSQSPLRVRIQLPPPSSPSLLAIQRQMIEIRASAAG